MEFNFFFVKNPTVMEKIILCDSVGDPGFQNLAFRHCLVSFTLLNNRNQLFWLQRWSGMDSARS